MLKTTIPPTVNPGVAPEAAGEEQPPRLFTGRAWWLLVAISLLSDFAIVPILSSMKNGPPSPFFFGVVGCTLAQGSLLAAWLVLFEGPFWLRLVRHWSVAFGLWLVWFLGLALAAPRGADIAAIGFTAACITPLVSLGAQLPIWAMRHFFGWRLARASGDEQNAEVSRLSIRDLLVATVVVAVTFAVARASPALQEEQEFWFALFIALAVASGVSTIAILPAATLLLKPRPFSRALALTGLYTFTLIGIHWLIVGSVLWYGVVPGPAVIHVGLTTLMLSYAGTCCLAAYVARQWGYYVAGRVGATRS
jgi:hypothetical protein